MSLFINNCLKIDDFVSNELELGKILEENEYLKIAQSTKNGPVIFLEHFERRTLLIGFCYNTQGELTDFISKKIIPPLFAERRAM